MRKQCQSCLDQFQAKHVALCHGCKAWYCRDCVQDHKPCMPPLPSSNRKDTALVKPESQFDSGWELEPKEPELTPFDEKVFLKFQAFAGCRNTQQQATQEWKKVRSMLDRSEQEAVMDAWGQVEQSFRMYAMLENKPLCEVDKVCDRIRQDKAKKNGAGC